MKLKIHKNLFLKICILIILQCYIISTNAEETVVKVLMKYPDNPMIEDLDEWAFNYESLINDYISENLKHKPILNNVTLSFDFFDGTSFCYESLYENINDSIVMGLLEGEYDLMIIDDYYLFNDVSLMESYYLEYYYDRNYSKNYFLELSKYIEEESLNYHDPKIMNRGKIDGKLYALPYESDFDNLYYKNDDINAKNIANKIQSMSWDDLINSMDESFYQAFTIPLAYDENLLNYFIEYISNHYNLTKENDPNYYKVFYNDSSVDLFESFLSHTKIFSNDTLDIQTPEESMQMFLDDESLFFKGKASYAYILHDISGISSTLPPKFISAKYGNYLTINSLSNIDENILIELAVELTSKEMQLFRAKYFGSIPTFDFSKDSIVESYCEMNEEICYQLKNIKSINSRDIFKSKYSSTFFEVGLSIPYYIFGGLYTEDFTDTIFVFKYTFEMLTTQTGIFGILSIITVTLFSILFFVVMFLTYRFRKNPYIKVISPVFCNIIIIGCICHIMKILLCLPPYSNGKVKFEFINENLSTDLLYMPILGIVYRIYKIYNSNSFAVKHLSDKKLLVIVFLILLTDIVQFLYFVIGCDIYYTTDYMNTGGRYPMYFTNAPFNFTSIWGFVYYYVMVCIFNCFIYVFYILLKIKYI